MRLALVSGAPGSPRQHHRARLLAPQHQRVHGGLQRRCGGTATLVCVSLIVCPLSSRTSHTCFSSLASVLSRVFCSVLSVLVLFSTGKGPLIQCPSSYFSHVSVFVPFLSSTSIFTSSTLCLSRLFVHSPPLSVHADITRGQ